MYNYHIFLKKQHEKELKEKENKLKEFTYKKSEKQKQSRLKSYENRIKNFNYDVTTMFVKVNENVDAAKELLKNHLIKRNKLTDEEAIKRMNAGAYRRENEVKIKETILSNEVNKYICGQDKKTYFKSV